MLKKKCFKPISLVYITITQVNTSKPCKNKSFFGRSKKLLHCICPLKSLQQSTIPTSDKTNINDNYKFCSIVSLHTPMSLCMLISLTFLNWKVFPYTIQNVLKKNWGSSQYRHSCQSFLSPISVTMLLQP